MRCMVALALGAVSLAASPAVAQTPVAAGGPGSAPAAAESDTPPPAAADSAATPADSAATPYSAAATPEEAEEVRAIGRREPTSGSKLREPLRDIPATVNVITDRELKERGVVDAVSALSWVPGVNAQLLYGGFTVFTIRGFDNFIAVVDGMRDDRYTIVHSAPTANLAGTERVEVLKGPASALYGYGGIGGVVSFVSKSPRRTAQQEASVSLGAPHLLRRATLGITGPLGETAAYRVDIGLVDDEDFRRARNQSARIAGALDLRPAPGHRLSLRGSFSHVSFGTDTGLPTRGGLVPAGIPLDRRFNTAFDFLRGEAYDARVEYAYTPEPWLDVTARVGASKNPYSYKAAEMLATDAAPSARTGTVTREWFFLEHDWNTLYSQVEVAARGTVIVPQRALLGYELGNLASGHPRANLSDAGLAPVPFAASADPQGDYPVTIDKRRERWQQTHGVYLHDTLTLLPALKASLSGRLDHWSYEERNFAVDPATGAAQGDPSVASRSTTVATFRAGLVLQPVPWGTLYAAGGTGFRPVRVVSQDDRTFAPERGRQLEVGLRLEALEGKANLNVAAYGIEKTDVVVSRGGGVFEQAGGQSSRGVEVDATLRDLGGFSLRAGYAYTAARFDAFVTDAEDFTGKRPANVPDHQLSLWGTYRTRYGVGFGAGYRAVGLAFADPSNTVRMPPYSLVDAAVFYAFPHAELGVNVSNLLGVERYFLSSINDTQVTPGAPRTVLVTLRISS